MRLFDLFKARNATQQDKNEKAEQLAKDMPQEVPDWLVYLNKRKKYGIDQKEMRKLVAKYPNRPYMDLIWAILQERSLKNTSKPGLYRNDQMYMADLLYDEEKYSDALRKYGYVCFIDLNVDGFGLAPGIIQIMNRCQKRAGLSDNEIKDILKQDFASYECARKKTDDKTISAIIAAMRKQRNEGKK